jgi:hypothetical protein
MGGGDVFPAEMPEDPSPRVATLDPDTAERLLSGRLDPDDAPPGYAEVARLLQAAAAPADATELADEAVAANDFRRAWRGQPHAPPGHRGRQVQGRRGRQVQGRRGREAQGRRGREVRGRRASGARGRVVALALAGAVALGGVGVWTAGSAPFSGELRSPSGGPAAGGSGSGVPASRMDGPGAGGAGSLRPAGPGLGAGAGPELNPRARPGLGAGAGLAQVTDGRPRSLPWAREPATARPGGDVTSHGGGPPHGAKPTRPARQPKPKPEKPNQAREPKERQAAGQQAEEPSARGGRPGAEGRGPAGREADRPGG